MHQWLESIFSNDIPNRCLFRVDAGPVWGLSFGHLMRCLTLSKILCDNFGCDRLFLMRNIKEGKEYAINAGEKVKTIVNSRSFLDDDRFLIETVKEYSPDWVFIDLPYTDMRMSYLDYLSKRGINTFYIDDWRFDNPGTDIYHNSNVLASYDTIGDRNPNTKYLLGIKYLIIDHTVIDTSIKPEKGHFTVTLSFGGSDPTKLTQKVLNTIIYNPLDGVKLMIVLGPGNKDRDEINLISNEHKWINLYESPENIFNIFQKSNLVICSGGRTMYELYYLKKKFLPIGSIEHESIAIKEFVHQRIIQDGMMLWSSNLFLDIFRKFVSQHRS